MTESRFRAVVYGLSGDSKQGGERLPLEIRAEGLAVRGPGGEAVLSFNGVKASVVGAEQSTWMFQGPDAGLTICIDDEAAKRELQRVAHSRYRDILATLDRQQRKSGRTFRLVMSGVVFGTVGLIFGTIFLFSVAVDWAAAKFPISWEKQLGEMALSETENEKSIVNDAVLDQALKTISSRLLAAAPESPYDFKFHVVRSQEINAFALPGGNILFHTALIADAKSAEEVAGVMAHEMQHVLHRHGVRGVISSMGISVSFGLLLGFSADQATLLSAMAPKLLSLSFDRGQETEADVEGIKMLIRAGISPDGMVTFFERLADREGRLGEALAFVSNHPASSTRVADLKAEALKAEGKQPTPILLNWREIQERAVTLGAKAK